MLNYRIMCKGLLAGFLFVFMLASCGSVSSLSGGLNDESYVVLAASREFVGRDVILSIDDQEPIRLRVRKDGNNAVRRGERIVIQPGKHRVRVESMEGRLLFDKEIFVSTRNARKIELP